MNYINVVGGTKTDRALAKKVALFCIKELMPRFSTLDIEIMFTKCLDDGAYGFCYGMDTDREFTIEIDKRITKFKNGKVKKSGRDIFIETLCHEFVHVMQTAKGLMVDRVYPKKLGYRRLWKGVDHTKTTYSKQPWERQAYRMQGKLVTDFKKSEKK